MKTTHDVIAPSELPLIGGRFDAIWKRLAVVLENDPSLPRTYTFIRAVLKTLAQDPQSDEVQQRAFYNLHYPDLDKLCSVDRELYEMVVAIIWPEGF